MVIKSLVPALLVYDNKVMLYNNKAITFNLLANEIEITNFTVNEVDMGESVITMDVYFGPEEEPGFNLNWTVMYNGETYHLKSYAPPGIKDLKSLRYKYTLTFVSEREDLKFYPFSNIIKLTDGTLQTIGTKFAFLADLTEFVGRLNDNLTYYYGARWKVVLNPDMEINPFRATVSVDKTTIWDVLTQLYELYSVRWSIEEDNGQISIKVGFPAPEIEHIFDYGDVPMDEANADGTGLVSIQRVNDQTDIYTRLIGRGSTRNLPYRYFKGAAGAFVGDPDANAITELSYYSNLMPKSYRDYVRGWNDATAGKDPAEGNNPYYMLGYSDMKAGRQMYPSDYADSPMQEKWGVRVGVLEDNEEIYPSIQNVWLGTLGRADEVIAVEEVTNDNVPEEDANFPVEASTINAQIDVNDQQNMSGAYGHLYELEPYVMESDMLTTLRPNQRISCDFLLRLTAYIQYLEYNSGPIIGNPPNIEGKWIGLWDQQWIMSPLVDETSSIHRWNYEILIQAVDYTTGEVVATKTLTPDDWEYSAISIDLTVPAAGNYKLRITASAPKENQQQYTYLRTFATPDGLIPYRVRDKQGDPVEYKRWSANGFKMTLNATNIKVLNEVGIGEYKQTFDIWIKDIWGETGSIVDVWWPKIGQREATVMFSDGLLAGEDYEFVIAKDPTLGNPEAKDPETGDYWCIWEDDSKQIETVDEEGNTITVKSKYRLSLIKSDAELRASGLMLPNTKQNAKPGDHFFLINIEMPHQYVLWAEDKLQDYLEVELDRVDDENPTFSAKPSAIFCESFEEREKLRPGTKIRLHNNQLIGDTDLVLYINNLTIAYKEGKLLPEWTITVSEEMVASKTSTSAIQGEIRRLSSNIMSSSQIVAEAAKTFETLFLRKDGIAARSYSPTHFTEDVTFTHTMSSDNFKPGGFGGSGWGAYKDNDGNSVFEVDRLIVRRRADFNEVAINQVTFFQGKQVFSAAGGEIVKIDDGDGYWRCWVSDPNNATGPAFVNNDLAYSQIVEPESTELNRFYWRRIINVGSGFIDLSKTEAAEGSSEPVVGDKVVQLGNTSDTSRQSAIIIDVTQEGGALMTWLDDITTFSLVAKDNINLGRIEGKTWAEVFGNLYVGNRERTKYLKYESLADGKNELSFVGDVIRAAAEEAYFQGSFIAQGYIGVGSETKVESVLVGMTAEDADVPSGVAASEGRIRFWAGKPFSERYDAPTKILEGGKLISSEAEIKGEIVAESGSIGGFQIGDGRIGSISGPNDPDPNNGMSLYDSFIKFSEKSSNPIVDVKVFMGTNVFPATTGATCMARFESWRDDNLFGYNIGLLIDVRGGRQNEAIRIKNGCVSGLAYKTLRVNASTTIDHSVMYVSCYNTSEITITLPAVVPGGAEGSFVIVRRNNSANVKVNGNGAQILRGSASLETSVGEGLGDAALFLWDGQNWLYNHMMR